MVDRTQAELDEYMQLSVDLLRQAGFAPTGITQPCFFNGDRDRYAKAVLSAFRPAQEDPDGTVTFYFIDFQEGEPPLPPHPITLLDREKREAVVSILAYADDFFWNTQFPATALTGLQAADNLITADGEAGRLADLIRSDSWTVFVTHWQCLYANGSRHGLIGLDEVGGRLNRTFGPRLLWVTNSEIARYRVAEETTQITPLDGDTIQVDALFACPDFTFTLQSPAVGEKTIMGVEVVRQGNTRALTQDTASDGLMAPASWRQIGDRITFSFDLQAGTQLLRLHR
jgi:hypothetical protein